MKKIKSIIIALIILSSLLLVACTAEEPKYTTIFEIEEITDAEQLFALSLSTNNNDLLNISTEKGEKKEFVIRQHLKKIKYKDGRTEDLYVDTILYVVDKEGNAVYPEDIANIKAENIQTSYVSKVLEDSHYNVVSLHKMYYHHNADGRRLINIKSAIVFSLSSPYAIRIEQTYEIRSYPTIEFDRTTKHYNPTTGIYYYNYTQWPESEEYIDIDHIFSSIEGKFRVYKSNNTMHAIAYRIGDSEPIHYH